MRPYEVAVRGTVSMCPRSARPRPRPIVVVGPRPSAGSRTISPRRAPTRAAPARSNSWREDSRSQVRASRSVSSWRVVRSETMPASRSWMRVAGAGAAGGAGAVRTGAGAVVCGAAVTAGSIPATFGRCGALMASAFPPGAIRHIASQTPRLCCAAIDESTSTRTRGSMSSIVQAGILVSVGQQLTVQPRLELGWKKPEADGFCDRLVGRRSGPGYVVGDARGQLAQPGIRREPPGTGRRP